MTKQVNPQPIHKDILAYNKSKTADDKEICDLLSQEISTHLPEAENKIWHAHPVWFLDGNPIVGYSRLKMMSGYYSGAASHLKKQDCKRKAALKQPVPAILLLTKSTLRI